VSSAIETVKGLNIWLIAAAL